MRSTRGSNSRWGVYWEGERGGGRTCKLTGLFFKIKSHSNNQQRNDALIHVLFLCSLVEAINALDHVRKVYPMMYFWAPTYLVGCAAALLTLAMQRKNYKLSSVNMIANISANSWFGVGADGGGLRSTYTY